jgi:multidrug efflux pump subunit AcrB
MACNSIAANLLMLVLVLGGLAMIPRIKQEVFPEVALDIVTVTVAYPGAGPEEVEEGVVLAVEEAARGIDGVEEVRSTAREGQAVVSAEIRTGADAQRALDDIKSAVDRITSFPQDAERPIISLRTSRRQVASVIVHGDLEPWQLDAVAERIRSELLEDERITTVEIGGLPPPEISIEVPQENLRRYGLTLGEIAQRVAAGSVDLPGGGVETPKGEVLVRTTERRDRAEEFRQIAIINRPGGARVTLGEMADVIDGYRDVEREAFFDGKRAVQVRVFRVGDQTPIGISKAIEEVVDAQRADLPDQVELAIWNDSAEIYRDRVRLLLKNTALGLLLVLIILGLFLRPRLAFWVTLGMAIAFLGAFLFMAAFDVSINMISLFAFLLALGIVVDDAIVVGESVFQRRSAGEDPETASIRGAREVGIPVIYAVLTTILAFTPMLFVPGSIGKFFDNIPLIVIPILALSLIESLFILPAHLAHSRDRSRMRPLAKVESTQERFARGFERFVDRRYRPVAERAIRYRYLTLAIAVGVLIVTVGYVASGRIAFHFMPKIEGEIVTASIQLPFGAAVEDTRGVLERVVDGARAVAEDTGAEGLVHGIYAEIGTSTVGEGGPAFGGMQAQGGHLAGVAVSLGAAGERELSAAEFVRRWRERVGEVPGVDRLAFNYSVGPGAGAPIAVELAHEDRPILRRAAEELAAALDDYEGVHDIDDGFQLGKEQLDLTLAPQARALGISELDLARQVRHAFFGAEALRQQRGRDELRVYVRLPDEDVGSEYDIEQLLIRTPRGGEIPLWQAARVEYGRSYTSIEREGGHRVADVTADVDQQVTSGGEVMTDLRQNVLPELMRRYPGLDWEQAGEQQEQAEAIRALGQGLALALVGMFALMAIAFRSYVQPLIVMFAVPFGVVGAILGHLLMGYDLSLVSVFGIVALSGVVVNDSLVLIVVVNSLRGEGRAAGEALVDGGVRRFRPILLTSLTTFFGLTPMILETSLQARFLIPMAISLGFGVLFVTAIALLIVPAAYMSVEDARGGVRRVRHGIRDQARAAREPG